jgi:hypothetical protein
MSVPFSLAYSDRRKLSKRKEGFGARGEDDETVPAVSRRRCDMRETSENGKWLYMNKYLAILLSALVIVVVGIVYATGDDDKKPAPEQGAVMAHAVYVCPDCETVAMMAGACEKCGKAMKKTHVLGMKDGKMMLCDCREGCQCDMKGAKDGKCACGKEVKMMSCKGVYVCACPEGKCCNSVSDKPGKCACGMDMKKCE